MGKYRKAASRRAVVAATPWPTRWWRYHPATDFGAMEVAIVRVCIAKVEILGEPRWKAALSGDAASAIGMTLAMRSEQPTLPKFDLIATALAICACEGSAAACLVLSHVIRQLPGAGEQEARLATSWLVRAFRSVAERDRERGGR